MKKAECQRIDAFELWCWRRLLRVPCSAKRSNQSILKEISPEYSLEELMLKLKLHYSGHLMQTADSLEKTLILGKTEGRRKRGQQRMMLMFTLAISYLTSIHGLDIPGSYTILFFTAILDGWMDGWLDDVSDSMDMNLSKLREMGKDREARCTAVHEVSKSWI